MLRTLNLESENVAIALNGLAEAKREAGDWGGAEADYREALRLDRKLGSHEGIATRTGNLAELALDRQDWHAAERLAMEALALAKGVGRLELIASDHYRLAEALRQQQRAAEALPHAQEAVKIFTRLRHRDLAEAGSHAGGLPRGLFVVPPLGGTDPKVPAEAGTTNETDYVASLREACFSTIRGSRASRQLN